MLASEVGTESEREILVRLVQVQNTLTKPGRKLGMDGLLTTWHSLLSGWSLPMWASPTSCWEHPSRLIGVFSLN